MSSSTKKSASTGSEKISASEDQQAMVSYPLLLSYLSVFINKSSSLIPRSLMRKRYNKKNLLLNAFSRVCRLTR